VALAAEMRQITNLIAKARPDCALIAPRLRPDRDLIAA